MTSAPPKILSSQKMFVKKVPNIGETVVVLKVGSSGSVFSHCNFLESIM